MNFDDYKPRYEDVEQPEEECDCGHDHGVSTTRCSLCYWCLTETVHKKS